MHRKGTRDLLLSRRPSAPRLTPNHGLFAVLFVQLLPLAVNLDDTLVFQMMDFGARATRHLSSGTETIQADVAGEGTETDLVSKVLGASQAELPCYSAEQALAFEVKTVSVSCSCAAGGAFAHTGMALACVTARVWERGGCVDSGDD